MQSDRTEAGFTRTVCACSVCTNNCRHISGMISPSDLDRWQQEQGNGFAAVVR